MNNKQRQKEWAREQLARCTKFSACLYLGSGHFDVRWADSREGALQHKQALCTEHGVGARVLLYGVTPNNVSILIEEGM